MMVMKYMISFVKARMIIHDEDIIHVYEKNRS